MVFDICQGVDISCFPPTTFYCSVHTKSLTRAGWRGGIYCKARSSLRLDKSNLNMEADLFHCTCLEHKADRRDGTDLVSVVTTGCFSTVYTLSYRNDILSKWESYGPLHNNSWILAELDQPHRLCSVERYDDVWIRNVEGSGRGLFLKTLSQYSPGRTV